VGKTCLRLTADFYLGGDRDRVRSYASILYSTDGGTTWKVLVPNVQATIPNLVWLAYHYVAGTCNNWIRLTFNFPTDAENIPNLRIAFRWRNDNSFPMTTADYTLSAGFNVDNIRIEAAAPPTANFTADKTTVCKYETVTFTNLTSIPCNLATTYTWTITPGTFTYVGGTNANSVHPQVQFTANGTYTVSLTATNAAGTHTFTQANYITVTACPPIANFTADRRSACALNPTPPSGSPTTVTLTDISDLRGQPFTSRTWTITPSTGVNIAPGPNASPVTVTFTNPGTYTVQLSVTTPDGTDDTIATQILNIASCACGGASTSSVDSTVFYTQNFDGCSDVIFSSNGTTSCGWRTEFIQNGSGFCRNHWRIDANEAGVTPPSCGTAGGSDKSLYMGATGGLCSWICSGACYDDAANTDKRIYLNSNINFTAGALYPYDSIVVQFDFIAYGAYGLCGSDWASFEYSTNGGATWISPVATPGVDYWVVAGALGMDANPMQVLESNICSGGQGQWTRIRWRVPAAAMSSTQFRIAFRWRNQNDGCGVDPSFAVDDIRIVGYKGASTFTSNQYIGPNGGSWHVAANWSANNVPDNSSEDAEIPAGKHVVISNAVEVRHVCNFGKITIDDAPAVHLTVRGNLLNEGEITSTGTTPDADVRLGGADTRYRGTGTNIDADYAIISAAPGKTTLEADLSCRSLRISGGFDMSNRTVTLYRDLSYTTGTITYTGSTVLLNGPCSTCLDNNALQQISANLTLNLHNLVVNKASGTVLQQAADVRINGTMTIHGGVYDAQTNQLRDGAGGPAPLVMTGGELRLARLGTTLPELSGAYTLTGGKVTLYGAGGQTLRGNRSFWDLRFENTGIKTLGGGGNTIVKSNLELALTSDYVDANANNVILWVQNPSLFAVSRTGGHVVGRLRRNIQGLGQYRFDVGSTTDYERFDVLIRQPLMGVSHLTTQFIANDPTDPSPAVLESGAQWQIALPPGYWQVDPDVAPTAGLYDAISYPIGFTLPANPLQYTLGKRPNGNGADWSQTLTGVYVTPAGGIVRRNSFSAFSEFGILTSPTPLPNLALRLWLYGSPDRVRLAWQPSAFLPVQAYQVTRSTDQGRTWTLLATQPADVSRWIDPSAPAQAWYRVQALLSDGRSLASNVVEYQQAPNASPTVEVLPLGEAVHFVVRGDVGRMQVRLWNALGQEVGNLSGEGMVVWTLPPQAAAGVYFYQVVVGGEVVSGRVWVGR